MRKRTTLTNGMLLRRASELRQRAAAAPAGEGADLLFLATEYEAAAASGTPDKDVPFFVELPN